METVKTIPFDLQLFAEEESEETSEETIEEATDETESETVEEKTEYEFNLDGELVKVPKEDLHEVLAATKNKVKWQATLHEKGEKLNRQMAEVKARERELANIERAGKEWLEIEKKLKESAEGRQYLQNLLNSKPTIDPVLQKQQDDIKELKNEIRRSQALTDLMHEYPDYDDKTVTDFVAQFDPDDPKDMMKFSYYAMRGANLEQIVAEERAKVVRQAKNKKGLPATGKKEAAPNKKFKTVADMVRAAHEQVNAGVSALK